MDSYVNSLGNFAAGVGVEALAGATGQATARRGRAGPGGSRRWLAHWLCSASSPLAPRPATSAPGPPQTREGRSLETRTRKPEARAALHLPPSPTPSSSLSSSPALRLRSLTQTEGALWPSASSASP